MSSCSFRNSALYSAEGGMLYIKQEEWLVSLMMSERIIIDLLGLFGFIFIMFIHEMQIHAFLHIQYLYNIL